MWTNEAESVVCYICRAFLLLFSELKKKPSCVYSFKHHVYFTDMVDLAPQIKTSTFPANERGAALTKCINL